MRSRGAGGEVAANQMRLSFNRNKTSYYFLIESLGGGIKKKENPDAIIIIAHIGFDNLGGQKINISTWTFPDDTDYGTLSLARAAKGADVVIGGHNHTGLLQGYHDRISGALLAESYYGLTDVSKISLQFDDTTGKLTGVSDELIPLWTDSTGEDSAVTAIIGVQPLIHNPIIPSFAAIFA